MTPLGQTAPREARAAKARKPEFRCDCGEEWDAPAHQFWLGHMRCVCGEIVEAR